MSSERPDETGRVIDLEVEVPGTPEQVWEAIATGPGISSWFIPMTVDEEIGGEVVMDFGELGSDTATVAAWEPPHRVVFRGGGERPLAYEWLVEARSGDTCIVRLVNSGFGSGEDWDGEYHGMSEGWKIFLQNLRLHLTHFPGRTPHTVIPSVMVPGPRNVAWAELCERMGVPADARAGDTIVSASGAPALRATVESRLDSDAATALLLVVEEPAEGTAFLTVEGNGDTVGASLYLYLYGEGATAADAWAPWLREQFAASAPAMD